MSTKVSQTLQPLASIGDVLKGWTMVSLTFLFVVLYGAALIGWLRPLADEKMLVRLEPIIFAIVGYYFGRLPGQQNEKILKDEIGRQTQRADAAQYAKEQAQQARESLEEKTKNVKTVLSAVPSSVSTASNGFGTSIAREEGAADQHVKTAIRILDS